MLPYGGTWRLESHGGMEEEEEDFLPRCAKQIRVWLNRMKVAHQARVW